MKRAAILAAIAAAACGSKHRDAAPCDQLGAMVDRLYAGLMKDVAPGMTPHEKQRAAEVSAKVAPAMKDAIVGSCRADAWTPEIVRCMAAAADESALDDCEAKLTADQRKRVEAAMGEVTAQITPPDDEPAEDTDGELGLGESGLAECDVYAHALERYLDCDEISEAVKDSARAGLAQLRQTWPLLKDPATAASAKQAAAAACVEAQRELDTSAKAMGCGAHVDAGAAGAAAASCTVLGPMIHGILAEQLRSVPADKQAAAEAQSKQLAAPLEQSLIATCERGRWSASAIACFGAARTAQALVACEAQLTPEQTNLLAQAMEDATTKIAGGAAPAGDAGVAGPRIAECDDYLAAVNAMLSCDKLPAEDRARMQRSTALVVEGLRRLADPSLPASARTDAAATCAKALAAAKQLAAHLGC